MLKPQALLRPTRTGRHHPPGDFHIGPTRPAARAVINHGREEAPPRWSELRGQPARALTPVGHAEEGDD